MPTERRLQKRQRKAEALRESQKKRRRYYAAAALLIVLIGSIGLAVALVRFRRMNQVYLSLSPDAESLRSGGLADILLDGLASLQDELVQTEVHDDTDIIVTTRSPLGRSTRSRRLAMDPLVLVFDNRYVAGADEYYDRDSFSILELESLVSSGQPTEGSPSRSALVVAGDDPETFAAFVMALGGELLDEDTYERAASLLSAPPGEGFTDDDTRPTDLEDAFAPVIGVVLGWRSRGILPANWTDLDTTAVDYILSRGDAAAAILFRSVLDDYSFDERFHLRSAPTPVGPGRSDIRIVGRAVSLVAGSGPRADALESVSAALLDGTVQRRIREETSWTPVALEGPPIDREHRDLVRWYGRADRFTTIDTTMAAHPFFDRLHFLLRTGV